jgi:hypothetical protein
MMTPAAFAAFVFGTASTAIATDPIKLLHCTTTSWPTTLSSGKIARTDPGLSHYLLFDPNKNEIYESDGAGK